MGNNNCCGTSEHAYMSGKPPEIGQASSPNNKRRKDFDRVLSKESSMFSLGSSSASFQRKGTMRSTDGMTDIKSFLKKHTVKELMFYNGHANLVESYLCEDNNTSKKKII